MTHRELHPKKGRVESPTMLAWVRAQVCVACIEHDLAADEGIRVDLDRGLGTPAPSTASQKAQAHHFPVKGMGGAHCRDDQTMPLCQHHHDQAQTYVISRDTQRRWAQETRLAFLDFATPEEVRLYIADLERWKERPLWIAW